MKAPSIFNQPESVAEQQARLEAEARRQAEAAARQKLRDLALRRLTGGTGDLLQPTLGEVAGPSDNLFTR